MTSSGLCLLHVLLLCGRSAKSSTEFGVSSSTDPSPTHGSPFSSPTPPPGGSGAPEEDTLHPSSYSALTTETPPAVTETASPTTVHSLMPALGNLDPPGCLCDLTPDFCDIGCCCDTTDCGVTDLATVFTGCRKEDARGVCIEKWLMFGANVDSSLVTVTDTLFCVQADAVNAPQPLPALTNLPPLGNSYHFSLPGSTFIRHSRAFYRVDDVIQTFFSNSSVRGFLRQPSPGVASTFCFSRNPTQFLRSTALSCARMVTSTSCTTDTSLSAGSYFSDMSLIKFPTVDAVIPSDVLIPVTPLSDWPAPVKQNAFCVNVVRKVEFTVGYTTRGELTHSLINITLGNVPLDQPLLQTHSVQFQLARPSPGPGEPGPPAGLREGSAVIGRFNGEILPLTSIGVSEGGACSSDPNTRSSVLFSHNAVTGCTFSSQTQNCTELRSQIYEILRGSAAPDVIAMNSGSQPDWTRVITQECPVDPQESCESGCIVPHSLSIQVLWARQGFIELPQNFLLGAKFLFHCQNVQCPLSFPFTLTAQAAFAEATVYPESPRGVPQPHWRFPFGFFSRGAAELDGHVVTSAGCATSLTWTLLVLPSLLLGLSCLLIDG